LTKKYIDQIKNKNEEIFISSCCQYYTYKGIHYDIAFPIFWVLYESPETGPHNCKNCLDKGMFRGVFIMYCANCATFEYANNSVGYGAIESGVELGGEDVNKSAWNTYLKYRDVTCIGLKEEREKINFERPGYTYKLVYNIKTNLNLYSWYLDFVYDEDYADEGDEDYQDEDYDVTDNESEYDQEENINQHIHFHN